MARIWFERRVMPLLRPYVPSSVDVLGPGRPEDTHAGIETAQAAIVARSRFNERVFDRAPGLVAICRTGIGCDSIDLETATRRGVAVCNAPDGPTVSTAEHTVALMLAVSKSVVRAGNQLRNACGDGDHYATHLGIELRNKTLGLVGFGRIARHVAAIGTGLSMHVYAYDPYIAADAFPSTVVRAGTLEELLMASDVVSVHVPMTPTNAQMFDARAFATMKPGAVFVNAARGGLVDHDALLEALDSGHLFGAGLDVTDPEPLDTSHPLLHRPNVTVTPHVAAGTDEARVRMFQPAVEQAIMVIEGRRPPHIVNPDAWKGVIARL